MNFSRLKISCKPSRKPSQGGFILIIVLGVATLAFTLGSLLLASRQNWQANSSKQVYQTTAHLVMQNDFSQSKAVIMSSMSSMGVNSRSELTSISPTYLSSNLVSRNQNLHYSIYSSSSSVSAGSSLTPLSLSTSAYSQPVLITGMFDSLRGAKANLLDVSVKQTLAAANSTTSATPLLGDLSTMSHSQTVTVRQLPVSAFTVFGAGQVLTTLDPFYNGVSNDSTSVDVSTNASMPSAGRIYVEGSLRIQGGVIPLTYPLLVGGSLYVAPVSALQIAVPASDLASETDSIRRRAVIVDSTTAAPLTQYSSSLFRNQVRSGSLRDVKLWKAPNVSSFDQLVATSALQAQVQLTATSSSAFSLRLPPNSTSAEWQSDFLFYTPVDLSYSSQIIVTLDYDTIPLLHGVNSFSFVGYSDASGNYHPCSVRVKARTLAAPLSIIADGTIFIETGFNDLNSSPPPSGATNYPASLIAPRVELVNPGF